MKNSKIFEILDADGDGFINESELDIGLQLYGLAYIILNDIILDSFVSIKYLFFCFCVAYRYGLLSFTDRKVKKLFQRVDTNNDGKIDLSEFIKIVKSDLEASTGFYNK